MPPKDRCVNYSEDLDEKPPLGLTPRHIREQERITEIIEAMQRYSSASKTIPQEWVDELAELNAKK